MRSHSDQTTIKNEMALRIGACGHKLGLMQKPDNELRDWKHFWDSRWEANQIGFHQAEVEPFLEKYFSGDRHSVVFVPLCGKTEDMVYLSKKVRTVIGAELNPIACEAFFSENKIAHQVETLGEFKVYQSENILLYCGDFFKLKPEFLKDVNFVYDRAALIALPPELRGPYVTTYEKLFGNRALTYLLIALEYDDPEKKGPPFSVSPAVVQEFYSLGFQIQLLESDEDVQLSSTAPRPPGRTVEHVYLLEKKIQSFAECDKI
jgi:thiopurine S-methyltransferase